MTWRTPFRPLRDGDILDAGYGEFWVTPAFADELMSGGMTHINGAPVTLKVVDRLPGVNAVALRWHPAETLEEMAHSNAVPVTTTKEL